MASLKAIPDEAGRPNGVSFRSWLMLAALTFVYVLNFLDRQLLGILAKPIQDSLQITDGQLGRLTGLYFAFFYCFIAIPIGYLADRLNRVSILSVACAIWSAATAACGLAANYPQLIAARMVVGVGEAGGVPPSYALISDTFPPRQRGIAFGVFNLGPPIGSAIGISFGAAIAVMFDWRHAFIAIGAIGVVTAILVRLLMREPERGATDERTLGDDAAPLRFWPSCAAFFRHPVLLLAALGGGATQFVTYGLGNFAVLFLQREKGMSLSQVAVWYALAVLVGMGLSMLISGRLIDRLTRRSRIGYALIPATSLAAALPLFVWFVGESRWPVALAVLTLVNILNYFYLSAAVALVQQEVRPNQRVLSGALLLLIMNFIGLGLGPTWVGWMSDHLKDLGHANSLGLALYTLAPAYLVAIALFLSLAGLLRTQERIAA